MQSIIDFWPALRDPSRIITELLYENAEASIMPGDLWAFQRLQIENSEFCWEFAAKYGQLEFIKYLHENQIEGCTICTMKWATLNGRINIVKFLCENRTEGCTANAIDWARDRGYFSIAEYIRDCYPHLIEGYCLRSSRHR